MPNTTSNQPHTTGEQRGRSGLVVLGVPCLAIAAGGFVGGRMSG